MSNDVSVVISGAAGQGMQVVAYTLAKVFSRSGYFTFTYHDIMSRIRGGDNSAIVRIKNSPVNSIKEEIDLLIAFDREALASNIGKLKDNGVLIYESGKFSYEESKPNYFAVPLEKIALESGKDKVMSNTVAVGAALAFMGWNLDSVVEIIKQTFSRKGEDVVNNNINAVKSGYDYAKTKINNEYSCKLEILHSVNKRLLISGSESVACGAISSGLKFYSGYPMSPSTAIMEFIAAKAREYNIVFEQSEDEISAINMIIGASYAGARSMTATSGGGFSLMVEGLSLAGMTETPVVIVVAQRPGPATGFPTRTEQADLQFILHAAHGEFPRVIFAPRSPADAIYLVSKAFNLAEKYQIPVIILTDQYFNDSYFTVNPDEMNVEKINRGNIIKEAEIENWTYKRYKFEETGISGRIIPGIKNQVSYADSDEHTEEGHITESADIRIKMVDKRIGKLKNIAKEINQPLYDGNKASDILLIGWGSTFGAIKEASELLNANGISAGVLHFNEIYPLPEINMEDYIKKSGRIFCVEGNAAGQFADLFQLHTGIKIENKILRYDGRPITAKYIMDRI